METRDECHVNRRNSVKTRDRYEKCYVPEDRGGLDLPKQ